MDAVVNMRSYYPLPYLRKNYPSAKLFLWCEDLFTHHLIEAAPMLSDLKVGMLCVSRFHKEQARDFLSQAWHQSKTNIAIAIDYIFNPISDELTRRSDLEIDPNKMVYFSSPHKGLDRTLSVFKVLKESDDPEIKRHFCNTRLYVANPGYFKLEDILKDEELLAFYNSEHVVRLGPLPHEDMMKELRTAWCVFHLNSVFPETHGIVHSEAHALGIPFLAHALGATPEVCDHPDELVDVRDNKAVIDRLIEWKKHGPPRVSLHNEMRETEVLKRWVKALGA